jgi:hypothetical protein
MKLQMILALSAAMLAGSTVPGLAGPCTADIDRLQVQVDAKLEAAANTGPAGRETTGALLHHQPTPESIARAEGRLDEGAAARKALEALARARESDQAGNAQACTQALAEAQRAINP